MHFLLRPLFALAGVLSVALQTRGSPNFTVIEGMMMLVLITAIVALLAWLWPLRPRKPRSHPRSIFSRPRG